jgi:hypothetical protein
METCLAIGIIPINIQGTRVLGLVTCNPLRSTYLLLLRTLLTLPRYVAESYHGFGSCLYFRNINTKKR